MTGQVGVQIKFGHVLADYAGTRQASLQVPAGTTLRQLFDDLSRTQLSRWAGAQRSKGEISAYLRIFRNGELISPLQLDAALVDGDELLLLPAIAGG